MVFVKISTYQEVLWVITSILHQQSTKRYLYYAHRSSQFCAVLFSKPRHPWDRGTNENTNGLLREYFPKGDDLSKYSDEYIQSKVDELNKRPRKCLGYLTPYEVYYSKSLHLIWQFKIKKAEHDIPDFQSTRIVVLWCNTTQYFYILVIFNLVIVRFIQLWYQIFLIGFFLTSFEVHQNCTLPLKLIHLLLLSYYILFHNLQSFFQNHLHHVYKTE